MTGVPSLSDIDVRLRLMDAYPGVVQVLTLAAPPLETLVTPGDAVELARIANDELAELVAKYPDRFIAAVACLPLNDMDAALEEADRAITELKLVGVQLNSNINGAYLGEPQFRPLYEKVSRYDLPLWIHPWFPSPVGPRNRRLDWPYDTSLAMLSLVRAGVFEDYPTIKFITHHCGGMIPFFAARLGEDKTRKFYNDTAIYGNTPALMCGHAHFGTDHLLFGTDMPLARVMNGFTLETIEAIEHMDIPDVDKNMIFEGNAKRLLRLS